MYNEVSLSLCIWEFNDITHDDITNHLGFNPSKVYIKGEKKNPNFSALTKKNGWIIDSPFKKGSFKEQFDSLITLLKPKIPIIQEFSSRYYCEISCGLFVNTDTDESTPWVHLDENHITFLNECKMEIDFDIILLTKEDN